MGTRVWGEHEVLLELDQDHLQAELGEDGSLSIGGRTFGPSEWTAVSYSAAGHPVCAFREASADCGRCNPQEP